MAPVLSKIPVRPAVAGVTSASLIFWLAFQLWKNHKERSKSPEKLGFKINGKAPNGGKIQLNRAFLNQLWPILKIVVPGCFTPEAGFLALVAVTLMTKTYCDMWLIKNGTLIESAIIGRNWMLFKRYLGEFIVHMPLISIVNNLMKFGLSELSLRFRTRLSAHLYEKYMSGFTYYKMNNLDTRVANADQLLTQDVEKFCDSLTQVYSNVSKPVLDIIVYLHFLTASIGFKIAVVTASLKNASIQWNKGPTLLISYLILAGFTLNRIRKPVARLTANEQKLEGEFRYVNSRLITNSEEVAFYQGNSREKLTLNMSFRKLIMHLRKFIRFRFTMGFLDNIIARFIATVVGYLIISEPFFNKNSHLATLTHTVRQVNYYTSGKMLLKMAESIGRLVLAGREMTRLAGFTARVTELLYVLEDIEHGNYVRTMIDDKSTNTEKCNGMINRAPLIPGSGKIVIRNNIIKFEKVPLVTPNGDVLVEELNFEVKSGMNVLVCGPNGCGKSSLFRILGELWPLFGGVLIKPDKRKLFYIPQRPYMTIGTLRDQVIYPDSHEDQMKKNISDEQLTRYLEMVQLNYLLEREGDWDAVQDWLDVLSGGEKQRIAMARLFYHKPQFAILDECTSAVSVDVEGSMYQYCRQFGITLFTVSHRKSLWKHHEFYLHMDGRGAFEFKPIEADTNEFGS